MAFNYSVVLSDPTNAGGATDAVLVYDLQQALGAWSQYINATGNLIVQLSIANTSTGRESGGPTTSFFIGKNSSGINIFEPSSQYALTTGNRVPGSTSDVTVTVDPGYFKTIDLSPNLTATSAVAQNKLNPIVVFMHELGHGFGMTGYYSQAGVLPANTKSTFDALIQYSGGPASFGGAYADFQYGGAVPLTTGSTAGENFYHFGSTLSDFSRTPTTVQDPLTLDLMNGIVFFSNAQYKISSLDVALLKDLGYQLSAAGNTLATTRTDSTPNNTIDGSIGNVTINALGGNATIKVGPNDTITGGSGINTTVYAGASKNYATSISPGASSFNVQDKVGTDGIDALANIQKLQFTDQTIDTSWFAKTAALSSSQIVGLTELYIASFNRAPDALGLDYWGSQLSAGMSLGAIAASFFVQPEAAAFYPAGQSTQTFVNQVYSNVLGRVADPAGASYWGGQLQSGSVGKSSFLLAIINGVLGADAQYLANKEAVGAHFALAQGLSDTTWAKTVMANVNGAAASVTAANAQTDSFASTAATSAGSELVVKILGIVA